MPNEIEEDNLFFYAQDKMESTGELMVTPLVWTAMHQLMVSIWN